MNIRKHIQIRGVRIHIRIMEVRILKQIMEVRVHIWTRTRLGCIYVWIIAVKMHTWIKEARIIHE